MYYLPIKYNDEVIIRINNECTLFFLTKKFNKHSSCVYAVGVFDSCLLQRMYFDTKNLMKELKVYLVNQLMLNKDLLSLDERWFIQHISGGV